jgi:hypothetical protein
MAGETAPKQRVTIFKHGGQVKVWPPYVILKAGESVVFSTVGTSATVVFPNNGAFDGDKCDFDVPDHGEAAIFNIAKNTAILVATKENLSEAGLAPLRELPDDVVLTDANDQIYAYSVYCGHFNDLGQGQSCPVMIIEPPEKDPPS